MRAVIALALLLAASSAAADPAARTDLTPVGEVVDRVEHPIAFAVNNPLMWRDRRSFGASLYIGVTHHHAIRANFASYEDDKIGTELLALSLGSELEGYFRLGIRLGL